MCLDLQALYQEIILDHNRHPSNFKKLDQANYVLEGYNPLCGDKIILYLSLHNNLIQDIGFQGEGCAIFTASASLMTEAVKGKTVEEARKIFKLFHDGMTTSKDNHIPFDKLSVLSNVKKFPMRVKCATLAWHVLKTMIDPVSDDLDK
ncbi:MAG: SUF system NifU family Fe-S cluster assembly protein [Gammaproteobacteria bacterium RIFCSPHIGHO2_02_FULL_42_13]|nr:MAG: SUF system NifU family Fe-S cluster assembly protein [Gammaproteobacteria bacterium RIFCSPHIGHO2_02_FULL_42_13]